MKVVIVLFVVFAYVHCTKVYSRQNYNNKETVKYGKSFRSRGEVMENLFNIFDPSFLSYVWPKIKNGIHLGIGQYCWDDVSVFLKHLLEGRAWAYRAADASGRYNSGFFAGKRFWLGSKEECLSLDEKYMLRNINETWGEFYSGEYLNTLFSRQIEFGGNVEAWRTLLQRDELLRRVSAADNEAPLSLAYTVLQLTLNITKVTMPTSHEITLGLCLPRACTGDDVVSIINFSIMLNDNLRTNATVSRTIRLTSLRHVERYFNIKNDVASVSLILITIIILIIAIVATAVDLELIKFKRYNKSISFDLEQYTDRTDANLQTIEANNHKNKQEVSHYRDFKKVTLKKVQPVITKHVPMDVTSCARCGKYKKQCVNPLNMDVPSPRAKHNSCTSLNTEYKKKNNIYKSLLLCFSVKHSWVRVFNPTTANRDLAVVHLLKIFSVLWITFVHVAVIANYFSDNGADVNNYGKTYYIVSSGSLAFDTLFFVSGLFSAQHFLYLKSSYSAEELSTLGGIFGQILQLVCFIINRAVRLLPPYLYAILLACVTSRAWRDTAALALPEQEYGACAAHWWRNVLYLTDLYPRAEQCMQISWYLSAETKLHMFGALLCLLLASGRRRLVVGLGVVALLGGTGFDVFNAYIEFGHHTIRDSFTLYGAMSSRVCVRAAPYTAGVAGGWLLHVMDGNYCISKRTSWCLWLGTVLSLSATLALQWTESWVCVTSLTWSLTLIWPVIVCSTKYTEGPQSLMSGACGLSRLCYAALLLGGACTRALLLPAAPPADGWPRLWLYFCGAMSLTWVAALALSLFIEMPCCCLLRRISDYTHR